MEHPIAPSFHRPAYSNLNATGQESTHVLLTLFMERDALTKIFGVLATIIQCSAVKVNPDNDQVKAIQFMIEKIHT